MQLKIRYPPKKRFTVEVKKITKFITFKQLELWHVEEEIPEEVNAKSRKENF